MDKDPRVMLTTVDNPWNPFTNWDEWLRFDNDCDYGTCEFVALFLRTSDQLSPRENFDESLRVFDDIIKHDPRKIYKKVFNTKEAAALDSGY